MKKKLCSLLIAVFVLGTCAMVPFSANAELAPLAPVEFLQDFEGEEIVLGDDYTGPQIEEMTGVPMLLTKDSAASRVSASIIEEEDGNKAIKLFTSANADQIDSLYVLDSPIVAGKLEASFEFKPDDGGSGAWHMLNIVSTSGAGAETVSYNRTGWSKSSDTATGKLISSPEKNAKGYFSLHLVFTRSDSADPWTIEIYDETGESPVLCYEGKTADDFGAVASVKLIRLYATLTGWSATFDNYSVKTTPIPTVLPGYDELNGAVPGNDDALTIRFDGAIPNPDDKMTIVKLDEEGNIDTSFEPIETEPTYNPETGDLTIAPGSFLEYDTNYKLVFESGGVMNHTFTTASAPLSVKSETITYTPASGDPSSDKPADGTFDVRCDVTVTNKTTDNKFVTIMLIAYGENGSVLKSDIRRGARVRGASNVGGERDTDLDRELSGLDASKVASVDVVVWEEADGIGYRPIG
ncbi:MAG: hypothetical protein IKB60_01150 [Clostridia bacterium]|nr:hypothetical protein [Clostridia bacterium]